MAVVVKEGNVFDSDAIYICHQVNCQGVMGSGVAKEVRERYPEAYRDYKEKCYEHKDSPEDNLGGVLMSYIGNGQYIVHCFAQNKYGYDGKQYTSLEALEQCFKTVANIACCVYNAKISMPYMIGCCRGGADWNVVKPMIDEIFKDCDVELWRLNNEINDT